MIWWSCCVVCVEVDEREQWCGDVLISSTTITWVEWWVADSLQNTDECGRRRTAANTDCTDEPQQLCTPHAWLTAAWGVHAEQTHRRVSHPCLMSQFTRTVSLYMSVHLIDSYPTNSASDLLSGFLMETLCAVCGWSQHWLWWLSTGVSQGLRHSSLFENWFLSLTTSVTSLLTIHNNNIQRSMSKQWDMIIVCSDSRNTTRCLTPSSVACRKAWVHYELEIT